MGARFDHRLLDPGCIDRSGIALPPAIQRSVPRRQAEFLAGRLCARSALEILTGTATVPPPGKDRSPSWPASVCGAITHNHHHALAMVARREDYLALGIDIEACIDERQFDEIAGEILVQGERTRLLGQPREHRARLLTLTFSLKESLYKALNPLTGSQFYFEHAELVAWSPDGRATLRLLRHLADDFPANTEIAGRFCMIGDDLLSYVAIPNPVPDQRLPRDCFPATTPHARADDPLSLRSPVIDEK